MLHSTRGIVLRNIKYGETSVVATIFTEAFGIQSYLINGVRAASRKAAPRAGLLQPPSILELVVYHQELKNLQRVKEFKFQHLYQGIFFDTRKNAVALFMVELLIKCLRQPEPHADLYHFTEDAFMQLDRASDPVTANFPLFFILQLAQFFGLRLADDYSSQHTILDLLEGSFLRERPAHPHFLEAPLSAYTSQLLKVMQPSELEEVKLSREWRRQLLQAYISFYSLHIQGFGALKSIPVLQEIL